MHIIVSKRNLKKGLLFISVISAVLSMASATISIYLSYDNDKNTD